MWIALVASLGLNLLVVGIVAGVGYSARHAGGMRGSDLGPAMLRYSAGLPAERRAQVRAGLEAERDKIKPLRDEVRQARREAGEALMREPFEPARFRAAQARLMEAETNLRRVGLDVFTDMASKLTGEERRELAAMLARRRGGHGPHERGNEAASRR